MILKKESRAKKIKFNINKLLLSYFIVTIVIGSILSAMVFQSVTFRRGQAKYLDLFSKAGRYEYLYLPIIAFKALKSNFSKFETIDLEIKFKDILILEKLRKESLASGDLPPRHLIPRVKVRILYNGEKYNADARFKGDRKMHYENKEKTSYKIELDKNNFIFGVKKFSIQKPVVRNYIHEWIFHELAREFDLIKLKYKFIYLSVNGENKGLYTLEEGFGKELIERNRRRNGPIFGLNEELNYTNINPVFEVYNKKYWNRPENISIATNASQKLRDFFDDKIEVKKVFDLEKWASYFAIVDLTGTKHGALLKSVKFYYNPINGLFEPIPFDGHRFKPNYHSFNLDYDTNLLVDFLLNPSSEEKKIGVGWLKKFFFKNGQINEEFYDIYLEKLRKISSKKFMDNFLSKNLKKIKKINSHIYADYFFYHNRVYRIGLYYFLLDDFLYHAENIRNKLNKDKKIQVLKNNKSEFLIKNYYKNYETLFVDKFICNKNNQNIKIKVNERVKNFSDTVVKLPEEKIENFQCTHVNFVNKNNNDSFLLKIDYINSTYLYKNFKETNYQILDKFFVKKEKQLFLLNDEVVIDQNLYIPKGLKVIVKPNQKILLTNYAFIISNSPWIIGGKDGEVVITGEKNNLGGGILISDTKELSIIQNTKISYLAGSEQNLNSEFLIFGSINFHQANVEINNVNFENIYSEDVINIFRSSFKINNNNYSNIFSDAIDIDFSNGEINFVNFENIKNDAIDFSGSKANISNSYFNNVNDKLISAGENSKINISKIKAFNSHAGIISKDGSEVYTKDVDFDGVLIPFAAYQKKKEYNHGLLIVKNYNINNFSVKWIKDKKSKIIANDIPLKIDTKNILSIINEKNFSLIKQQ